jgi:uroporphyrinogen-III synthase
MRRFKILSTKKLEPSLIERAEKLGIAILEQEFISVKPIWSEEKLREVRMWAMAGKGYVAFTSAHAVTAVDNSLCDADVLIATEWKIFCLSGKTKEALDKALALKKDIAGEAQNAAGLAQKIIEQGVRELVFFCGNKRRNELPELLKASGVLVHEVMVYETYGIASLVNPDMDGILFFSPSAVESFFSINRLPATVVCFAIGKTTADSIAAHTGNKVVISGSPGQEGVLAAVEDYIKIIN